MPRRPWPRRPAEPQMPAFLVTVRRAGPKWDPSRPLEQQVDWPLHAAFMDGLVEDGFIVLGGPLADEHRVVHAVEAESEDAARATFARDPWSETHLHDETIGAVDDPARWSIQMTHRAEPRGLEARAELGPGIGRLRPKLAEAVAARMVGPGAVEELDLQVADLFELSPENFARPQKRADLASRFVQCGSPRASLEPSPWERSRLGVRPRDTALRSKRTPRDLSGCS